MKDIYAILTGVGIEVPEDKKATLDKEWKENYRTIAEFEKATAKRDEYKASLDAVEEQLKDFDGVDLEGYKTQIDTLTKQLDDEKIARAADESKHQLDATIDKFMGGKQFVNDLTADSVRVKLAEELDKDTAKGRSIDDIFKALVSDKDGNQIPNILVDEAQQVAQQNRATFTQQMGKDKNFTGVTKESFSKMNIDERMTLKANSPELYQNLTQ
ncbi:hypothetical protein SAMN05443270_1073 [Lacrimispora sphenoides]|uniref:phage scaffolding protein n=1 Tax=Lacrimispora sphenoides TaxID=29370 RepID=UPI0008B13AE3|nr:hypothetical protein [Lacrimispora sphenoides]SET71182.1 hypothetical protein SAMN05443270_1073 [Lacrimispora sphenoides]